MCGTRRWAESKRFLPQYYNLRGGGPRSWVAPTLPHAAQVVVTDTADDAVRQLEDGASVRVVVSDIKMTRTINEIGFVHWLHEHRPGTGVVLFSGLMFPVYDASLRGQPFSKNAFPSNPCYSLCNASPMGSRSCGGFDEDEAESEGNNGTIVLARLLAA